MSLVHLLCSPVDDALATTRDKLDAGRGSDRCSLQADNPPRRTSVPQNAAAGPDGGQHLLVLLTTTSLTEAEGVMEVELEV